MHLNSMGSYISSCIDSIAIKVYVTSYQSLLSHLDTHTEPHQEQQADFNRIHKEVERLN